MSHLLQQWSNLAIFVCMDDRGPSPNLTLIAKNFFQCFYDSMLHPEIYPRTVFPNKIIYVLHGLKKQEKTNAGPSLCSLIFKNILHSLFLYFSLIFSIFSGTFSIDVCACVCAWVWLPTYIRHNIYKLQYYLA